MIAKMRKLDRKIEHKIANFYTLIIRQKIDKNGTIDKQNFWKCMTTKNMFLDSAALQIMVAQILSVTQLGYVFVSVGCFQT